MKDYSIFDDSETLDILEALDDILTLSIILVRKTKVTMVLIKTTTKMTTKKRNRLNWQKLIPCTKLRIVTNTINGGETILTCTWIIWKIREWITRIKREVCHRLGQSYLQESEVPYLVFTTLKYDDEYDGIEELEGLTEKSPKDFSRIDYQGVRLLETSQR